MLQLAEAERNQPIRIFAVTEGLGVQSLEIEFRPISCRKHSHFYFEKLCLFLIAYYFNPFTNILINEL